MNKQLPDKILWIKIKNFRKMECLRTGFCSKNCTTTRTSDRINIHEESTKSTSFLAKGIPQSVSNRLSLKLVALTSTASGHLDSTPQKRVMTARTSLISRNQIFVTCRAPFFVNWGVWFSKWSICMIVSANARAKTSTHFRPPIFYKRYWCISLILLGIIPIKVFLFIHNDSY